MSPDKAAHMEHYRSTLTNSLASGDLQPVFDLIADDVIIRSPRHTREFQGRFHCQTILQALVHLMPDFGYDRVWMSGDDLLMEFKSTFDGQPFNGIDVFTLNDEGKLARVEIFLKAWPGFEALGAAEDAYIMEAFKAASQ